MRLCGWHRMGKPPEVGDFKNHNCDKCAQKPDGLPTTKQLMRRAHVAYSAGLHKLNRDRKNAERRREIVIK